MVKVFREDGYTKGKKSDLCYGKYYKLQISRVPAGQELTHFISFLDYSQPIM